MTAPKKKGLSIGAAMKQRMGQESQAEAVQGQAVPSGKTAVPEVASEALESFNTRLPAGLHRRLKMHAAAEGRKIQDVVQAALITYLDKKE